MIPIYYGKNFTAYEAGKRMIAVHCDKCGCDYAYELKRMAAGRVHTPYEIGNEAAPAEAQAAASRELHRQLDDEAELVPCPQCYWIDEVAVEKYRRTEFGGCAIFMFVLTLAGTILGVWIGWILSRGLPADQWAADVLSKYIPATLWISLILVYAATVIARKRFDPNKLYPSKPAIPPGTPTPVFLDGNGSIVVTEQNRKLFQSHRRRALCFRGCR